VRVRVLHFVRLRGIVWQSARILDSGPEILYLCALASFARDAIKRKKTIKIPILSRARLPSSATPANSRSAEGGLD
jgi:hypothetical protein